MRFIFAFAFLVFAPDCSRIATMTILSSALFQRTFFFVSGGIRKKSKKETPKATLRDRWEPSPGHYPVLTKVFLSRPYEELMKASIKPKTKEMCLSSQVGAPLVRRAQRLSAQGELHVNFRAAFKSQSVGVPLVRRVKMLSTKGALCF